MNNSINKPPLGVKPRFLLDKERLDELSGAINRYLYFNVKIPIEWITEWNNLISNKDL